MTSDVDAAQDPAEPFDVVTAAGLPTGQVKSRAEVHRDGDWHRALHVWIAGRQEDGSSFLMFQRRSVAKDTWPNHFDATVGGHVRAGESLGETVREIEEEIGIAPDGLFLRPLGTRVCADDSSPGAIDHEIQDVYLLLDNRPLISYRLHPAELAALARFPLETLVPFLAGEAESVSGESFAPGAVATERIVAHHADFIPTIDRYSLRVAIAAGNVLRGDRHVFI